MNAIGDAVAIISGATETSTYTKFRQGAQFFYLCGVEVPRAILVIDGRAKSSTLFLGPGGPSNEGPQLGPDDEAKRLTGVEAVRDRATFADAIAAIGAEGRTIYMPDREETLGAGTTDRVQSHARATQQDVWDQRQPKEIVFKEKVQAAAPRSSIKNLDPIVDALRVIKSPAEVAVIRESTRIASLGILEAMKSAKPGMYEYELEAVADYLFKRHNAQGIAYFALVATGTNAAWPHYHAAQSKLEDGDLVLMDYAPDFHYYASDVTRMFPANGKFTPRQRELYGIYVKLYQALLASIGPGPATERLTRAHDEMVKIVDTFTFADPKIKAAAERFVAGLREPARRLRPRRRHGRARRLGRSRRQHARPRHGLHDRAGAHDHRRAHLHPPRRSRRHHGHGLRASLRRPADGDRRRRESDERTWPRGPVEGARAWIAARRPSTSSGRPEPVEGRTWRRRTVRSAGVTSAPTEARTALPPSCTKS